MIGYNNRDMRLCDYFVSALRSFAIALGLTPVWFRASLARGVRRNISLGLNGRRDHDINVRI
jgi:hypothetical protein